MAEGQQLDPWQSSYLQLKSMSAMLSDIHDKICKLGEGGLQPEETRLGFNPNLEIQDRGTPSEEVHREIEATGILPPSVLGAGPAERAREFARTGPIRSPIPTISVIPNLHSPNRTHGNLDRSYSSFGTGNGINRFPKIDFPTFDGVKPRSWVRKCEKYFGIFGIQGNQRVELASMYVQGRADIWLRGFLMQKPTVSWEELREAICIRFGEKQGVDIIEEFNKLQQKDDLDEYTERFEELRACVLSYDPHLPEAYFVSSYISGLKQEIKNLVKLSRPKSLAGAYEEARMQYNALQAIISEFEEPVILDTFASEIMDGIAVESFDSLEIALDDLKVNSFECLVNSSARKLFVEIPRIELLEREPAVMSPDVEFPSVTDVITSQNKLWSGKLIFDPGIPDMSLSRLPSSVLVLFSDGEQITIMVDCHICCTYAVSTGLYDPCFVKMIGDLISACKPESVLEIFDPGGVCGLLILRWVLNSSRINGIMRAEIVKQRLQWDPGGLPNVL